MGSSWGATAAFFVEGWELPKSISLSLGRAAADANLWSFTFRTFHHRSPFQFDLASHLKVLVKSVFYTPSSKGDPILTKTWTSCGELLLMVLDCFCIDILRNMMLSNFRSLWTRPESWQCFTAERSCLAPEKKQLAADESRISLQLAAGELHQNSTFLITKTPALAPRSRIHFKRPNSKWLSYTMLHLYLVNTYKLNPSKRVYLGNGVALRCFTKKSLREPSSQSSKTRISSWRLFGISSCISRDKKQLCNKLESSWIFWS